MKSKKDQGSNPRLRVVVEDRVQVEVHKQSTGFPSISKEEARQKLLELREYSRPKQQEAPKLEKLLFQARFSPQIESRMLAMDALVELANQSTETTQMLESSLKDEQPEVRAKAAKLVRFMTQPITERMMKRLIGLAWDKELLVRRTAVKSLAYHPDPRSIGPLMGLLGTRDEKLKALVMSSLHKINQQLGKPPSATDADC